MNNFDGFPANMQFTPVPNLFMNKLMPNMDIHELKCMLHIFQAIYAKKGSPRYVSLSELIANASLIAGMQDTNKPANEIVVESLASAVERKIILSVEVTNENGREYLYFLNTQNDRQSVKRIHDGEFKLPNIEVAKPVFVPIKPRDVFCLYEENIGLLTPMIAEELKDALTQYSEEWVCNAIREAVYANKRNWRYISRILERWTSEGRRNGTHRQNTAQEDPDKYISGSFGHLIRR
jgi:DnaD/phage-associated family protein